MATIKRVVLIGFSGTGKTTVARLLAERLGWDATDSDVLIEAEWGTTIPSIFRDYGEAAFRQTEREALARLLGRDHVAVATGGGAVVSEEAWGEELLGGPGTLVVTLVAEPETMLARLRAQAAAEGEAVERPMLAGDDPLARIRRLREERQPFYDRAAITIVTEKTLPELVAEEIAAIVRNANGEALALRLDAASASSEISVETGGLRAAGEAVRARWPKARTAWIVTDSNVGPLHAQSAAASLRQAGFTVQQREVAAGEGSKSLGTAGDLYDWMLHGGVERGDVIIALGGGVVGDLAGFVAATVLRGIGLVQVPTSLLAAVDSSVGGKTGINHAAGKNLIGAFLQPPLVIVDTGLLTTLQPRELRAGWGEVVKHAVIQRSTPGGARGDLKTFLERNSERLQRLQEPVTAYAIWRNIALKAAVVAEDERESGIRAFLNFGHTLGHAIEAADYRLLHGEAVAVGMRAAAEIGLAMGTCGPDEAARIGALIERYGLPLAAEVDPPAVLAKLQSDKKRVAGKQRFVLPLDGGGVEIRDDVPDSVVARALATVSLERTAA